MFDKEMFMSIVKVLVFGLEGLRPDELTKSENPEGLYKSFDVDDSRDVEFQVRNRIGECGNDPQNFNRITSGIWLRKDLEVRPVDESNERFRVSPIQVPKASVKEPEHVGEDDQEHVKEFLDNWTAGIELTYYSRMMAYSVMALSGDMFTAMANAAKVYTTKLTEAGFSRAEALLIVSNYMSDVHKSMPDRINNPE